MTFVTDLVSFGGSGVNFGDFWGFRGVTLLTFVKNFVTFGGSGGQLW